jgi:hypothetical protein
MKRATVRGPKFEVFRASNQELRTSCPVRLACRASRLRPDWDEMLLGETDQLLKSRGILDGHIG